MKRALCLLLFPLFAHAAEQDHSAHTAEAVAPVQADHSAHSRPVPEVVVERENSPAMQEARHMNMMMHGDSLNYLLLGERLEQTDSDTLQWDLQGWLGYDRDKLWLKADGEYDTAMNDTQRSALQLLYSHAVAPYWDLQAGLRRDDAKSATRNYVVLGFQGLAPNWFEVDAAAFLSEHGDLGARIEVDYDLRFTQRLVLQPRIELDYRVGDDAALLVGEGLHEASAGLRLRYEITRGFAPYVGVEWQRAFGDTADLLRAAGEDSEDTRVVAGLRFWY